MIRHTRAIMTKKSLRYLTQKEAQLVDQELMSSKYGFSIDQLMELAGLSVAMSIGKEFPICSTSSTNERILIVAGPGNNGGDALVAARHLKHFGYNPSILYPKRSSKLLFQGLVTQCQQLDISFVNDLHEAATVDESYDLILDGIFGFSFEGNIRPPFDAIIKTLQKCQIPIVSIDIPSGWHVEKGNENGIGLDPKMLISLTAPKLCAKYFIGENKIHYVGGRFVPNKLVQEYQLDLTEYSGMEQCVRI